jgi:uncharacterized repeat protein (TIGR02543 family)
VTYDGNKNSTGRVPTNETQYRAADAVTVLPNSENLAKDNHAFAGWNTKEDGSGTTYSEGQSFAMESTDVKLYAKWSDNPIATYTVKYDCNTPTGGSMPIDLTQYKMGETVSVLDNVGKMVRLDISCQPRDRSTAVEGSS